jgi:hypothetical protein
MLAGRKSKAKDKMDGWRRDKLCIPQNWGRPLWGSAFGGCQSQQDGLGYQAVGWRDDEGGKCTGAFLMIDAGRCSLGGM